MGMQLRNGNKHRVQGAFSDSNSISCTAFIVKSCTLTGILEFCVKKIKYVLRIRGRKTKKGVSVFSVCLAWCLNCGRFGSNVVIPEIPSTFSACFPFWCNSVITEWPIYIWRCPLADLPLVSEFVFPWAWRAQFCPINCRHMATSAGLILPLGYSKKKHISGKAKELLQFFHSLIFESLKFLRLFLIT